jgi:hypothetical protein
MLLYNLHNIIIGTGSGQLAYRSTVDGWGVALGNPGLVFNICILFLKMNFIHQEYTVAVIAL